MKFNKILNEEDPIRLALLGGSGVGKSSYITKLQTGIFQETHYPTAKFTPSLMKFMPESSKSRIVLDELADKESWHSVIPDDEFVVSRRLSQCLDKITPTDSILMHSRLDEMSFNNSKLGRFVSKINHKVRIQHKYYTYFSPDIVELPTSNDASELSEDVLPFKIPRVSPILVELVDTPSFNPNLVIPFLEISLGARLGEEYLHNLANVPRTDTSTQPLLVGSGAGELNGKIDGYVLMYSAVPSLNPPMYVIEDHTPPPKATSFELLSKIKEVMYESWKSYKLYKQQAELESEADAFSVTASIKQLWKITKEEKSQLKRQHEIEADLMSQKSRTKEEIGVVLTDDEIPSMMILCTHCDDYRASPLLIAKGKRLAQEWGCAFVQIDIENNKMVEESLAMMLRDVIERKK